MHLLFNDTIFSYKKEKKTLYYLFVCTSIQKGKVNPFPYFCSNFQDIKGHINEIFLLTKYKRHFIATSKTQNNNYKKKHIKISVISSKIFITKQKKRKVKWFIQKI